MLRLILADSELETIPKEIWRHPVVQKDAKKRKKHPGKILLDSSKHYPAMKRLKDFERRGRPDIVHITALSVLDTPLNREGLLRFLVHTRHNKVLEFSKDVRLPRNYNRFVGLIEQLFELKRVPPAGEPLITLRDDVSLSDLLSDEDFVVVLDPRGEKADLVDFMKDCVEKRNRRDICVVVGGFPHGDFLSKIDYDVSLCIDPEPLCAWTASMYAVFAYSTAIGLQRIRLWREE